MEVAGNGERQLFTLPKVFVRFKLIKCITKSFFSFVEIFWILKFLYFLSL